MMLSLLLLTFFFSLALTLAVRYFANKKELLDHPNERSSHTMPTPKGGGLAIMAAFYGALCCLYFQTQIDPKLFFALLSALPVILVSLIDDLYPLSAKIRLGVQLLSAAAALYFLGGIDSIDLALFSLHGVWLNLIALLGIIWMTNLYNFLDGIDGYAGRRSALCRPRGLYSFRKYPCSFHCRFGGRFSLFQLAQGLHLHGGCRQCPPGLYLCCIHTLRCRYATLFRLADAAVTLLV